MANLLGQLGKLGSREFTSVGSAMKNLRSLVGDVKIAGTGSAKDILKTRSSMKKLAGGTLYANDLGARVTQSSVEKMSRFGGAEEFAVNLDVQAKRISDRMSLTSGTKHDMNMATYGRKGRPEEYKRSLGRGGKEGFPEGFLGKESFTTASSGGSLNLSNPGYDDFLKKSKIAPNDFSGVGYHSTRVPSNGLGGTQRHNIERSIGSSSMAATAISSIRTPSRLENAAERFADWSMGYQKSMLKAMWGVTKIAALPIGGAAIVGASLHSFATDRYSGADARPGSFDVNEATYSPTGHNYPMQGGSSFGSSYGGSGSGARRVNLSRSSMAGGSDYSMGINGSNALAAHHMRRR